MFLNQEIFSMNNKTINEFGFRRILEGVINLVLDLLNSLYPTQPHSLIANYSKGLINFFLTFIPFHRPGHSKNSME